MRAPKVDAWQALVLRSMSLAELREESENPDNSAAERAAMRAEIARRKEQR